MLFHADRNVKENLFNMYKKDAQDQITKKNELKMQKINEERQYLENVSKREQLEEDKRKLEKMKRISDTMNEYNQMLTNKPNNGRLKKSKFDDVKINTYGVSTRGNQSDGMNGFGDFTNNVTDNLVGNVNYNPTTNNIGGGSNYSNNVGTYPNSFGNNDFYQREFNMNKKASLSPRANNVKKLVNFENNYNPSNDDFMVKMQKMEQQKMYKDYLDSQVNHKNNNGVGKRTYSRDIDTRDNPCN